MKKSYIRFDWAMKRLFRNKEYQIIEAFISVVLGKKVHIKNVFENGNRLEEIHDNDNRFDMVIEDEEGTQILVELQIHNEYAYFERYLFGTSNFLTKCINNEIKLDLIQKVNCINIITFTFYNNNDTVYHGKTEFRVIHINELLSRSPFQQQKFEVSCCNALNCFGVSCVRALRDINNFFYDGTITHIITKFVHNGTEILGV